VQAGDRGGELGSQGQVAAMRSRRRRPPRARRPAAGKGAAAGAWFPGAGRPVKGEQLHPGGQLAPDLVLGETVQGEVAQPGVLGGADPSPRVSLAPTESLSRFRSSKADDERPTC
jgi:hypothetical protein